MLVIAPVMSFVAAAAPAFVSPIVSAIADVFVVAIISDPSDDPTLYIYAPKSLVEASTNSNRIVEMIVIEAILSHLLVFLSNNNFIIMQPPFYLLLYL